MNNVAHLLKILFFFQVHGYITSNRFQSIKFDMLKFGKIRVNSGTAPPNFVPQLR